MSRPSLGIARTLAAGTLVPLVALAGCKEQVTTLDDVASVRVVHASPDAPAVDVYIEGITIPLGVDLEYGDASDFGLLPAVKGAVFELRLTGADPRSEPLFMSTGCATTSEINSLRNEVSALRAEAETARAAAEEAASKATLASEQAEAAARRAASAEAQAAMANEKAERVYVRSLSK